MENNQLATIEGSSDLTTVSEGSIDAISLLRLAIERNISPEAMNQLVALKERLDATAAKQAFNASMQAFQKECGPVVKTKMGARSVKYAAIEDVAEYIQPMLDKYGLCYRFDSLPEKGWVSAICIVTHLLGHSEQSTFKVPIDETTSSKGSSIMSPPQQYAAALSFAQRRALQNAFGIVTKGEDRDGAPKPRHGEARSQTAPAQPQLTPQQIKESLHGRIWNRMSPLPQFKGKTDEETYQKIDKWIIGARLMEPSEKFEDLPNARLGKIAEAVEEEFEATF